MTPPDSLLVSLLWLGVLAALVGLLWLAYRRPPQVSVERVLPPNGFQGTRAPLSVRLHLRSRRPMRFVLEDPPPRTVVPDVSPVFTGDLWGDVQAEVSTTLTLNRRGVYDWAETTLRWADPLGVFWRSVRVSAPQHLEVFPGSHGLILPEILRPLLSEGGLSRTLGLEDPISLKSVRGYVPGDPPGRIHWRVTARSGVLSVRDPERSAASSVTVFIDTQAHPVFVDSAVRLAASLVREALALSLPVAIATGQGVTPTGLHGEAIHAAMLVLARAQPNPAPPVIPPTRSGGNLIILTASPTPALIEQAMRARATASRVVMVAIPEGFYLEPGENPRKQWVGAPDTVRALERQAGALAGAGVLVYVLRGNQSVLKLGA